MVRELGGELGVTKKDSKLVYVLTSQTREFSCAYVDGVFDRPKAARKFVDANTQVSSRKKWKKVATRCRTYHYENVTYFIREYEVHTLSSMKLAGLLERDFDDE